MFRILESLRTFRCDKQPAGACCTCSPSAPGERKKKEPPRVAEKNGQIQLNCFATESLKVVNKHIKFHYSIKKDASCAAANPEKQTSKFTDKPLMTL